VILHSLLGQLTPSELAEEWHSGNQARLLQGVD
jgi:hypothetical protein